MNSENTFAVISEDAHVGQSESQKLASNLLDAVKQCQIRFGGRTELATESSSTVSCLCAQFEAVLQHGLRKRSPPAGFSGLSSSVGSTKGSTVLHVRDVMTSLNVNLNINFKVSESEPVFWDFVREFLNRHEQERYVLLKNVHSDIGQGRAWLRSALNEHSLERYMHMFLSEPDQLCRFYEESAFMRDQEKSNLLPNLAAGLGSILFAINIDKADLNTMRSGTVNTSPTSVVSCSPQDEPCPVIANDAKGKGKRKKKRAPAHQIVSFDEEEYSENSSSAPPTCLATPTDLPSECRIMERDTVEVGCRPAFCGMSYSADELFVPRKDETRFQSNFLVGNCHSGLETSSSCNAGHPAAASSDRQSSTCIKNGVQVSELRTCSEFEATTMLSRSQARDGHAELGSFDCAEDAFGDSSTSYSEEESRGSDVTSSAKVECSGSVGSKGNMASLRSRLRIPFLSYAVENHRTPESRVPNTQSPLTPINDASVGELYPVSHVEEVHSEDSVSIPSFSEEADMVASAVPILAQKTFRSSSCDYGTDCLQVSSSCDASKNDKLRDFTEGDLRQALLAVMQKKDESEEQNRSLRVLMEKEMEMSASLRIENEDLRKKHQEKLDKLQIKLQALSRENELLKHQLRKYVCAVQMLKRDGTHAHEAIASLNRDGQVGGSDGRPYIDYHMEAAEYEKKLIQVAEMHGELMEFNERLHRLLSQKELTVRRLKEELVDLRGPLPDDAMTSDDDISITSDYDASSMTAAARALINVWIPSAFLTGKTSDVHHVYQVYIRIRDDEWNVYRRYAQFYVLHKDLKKKNAIVNTFDFPPKKVLGNKDAKFVEERRRRLQHYLRCVVNLMMQSNADLVTNPDRETLTSLMPFFGELANPANRRRSRQHRSHGIFSRSSVATVSSPPTPHYTGL